MSTKTKGGLPKNLGEGTRNLFVGDPLDGIIKAEKIYVKGLAGGPDAPEGYGDIIINTPESYGAVGSTEKTSKIDSSVEINLALSELSQHGGVLDGGGNLYYYVKSPIYIKGKASIRNFKILVDSDFIGDAVFIFGEQSNPLLTELPISNLYVDGLGSINNIFRVVNARRVLFSNIKCDNAGGVLWDVVDGYEIQGVNFNLSGNIPPLPASPDTSIGFRHQTNDSSYINVKSERVAVGFRITAGGNRFVNTHAWSTFFNNQTKMRICYHISGRGNQFTNATMDSPARLDWAQPSSISNGGYGFYVDGDGSDVQLINPYLFLSSYGDSMPVSGSITPVYTDRSRIFISSPKVINDSGVTDAVTDFLICSSTSRLREATVCGFTSGGRATMPENDYIGGSFTQSTSDLLIGGLNTGITYGNRRSMYKRQGSLIYFNININLTSKGALTGALSIVLPVSNINENPDYKIVFPCLIENQNGTAVPVVAILTNNTSALTFRNAESGASITASNLTDTSKITVSGSYLTSTV